MKPSWPTSTLRPRLGHAFLFLLIVAASVPPPVAGQELGRLFFTPERRQLLDRQRQFNIQERQAIPEDPTLIINGVVTRSSGKRTVWINGVAQDEKDTSGVLTATPTQSNPGQIVIQANDSPAAKVSVGGTVNRNTGEASDLLDGGRITVKRK